MLESRNTVENDIMLLHPVTNFSIFTGFSCGMPDLDDFLHNDAPKHTEQLLAVTYVLYLKDEKGLLPPAAFISLMNDSVALDKKQRNKAFKYGKRYTSYPAIKIGRLGVRSQFQSLGIGTTLLQIIKRLVLTDNRTGCAFITVDAYNTPEAIHFYIKNNFNFLSNSDENDTTRLMYFDLRRFLKNI